jgi:ribonucleoside-diphosphate reductase alpha chain
MTVSPREWHDVTTYIYEHRQDFAGISLLPEGGDLDYPQAPFCAVPTPEEIVREYGVGSLMASGLIVDGLKAFKGDLWAACGTVLGRGDSLHLPTLAPDGNLEHYQQAVAVVIARKDWVRRAHKFAANYFSNDLRSMTYCLKKVHNCKEWEDLAREYLPVDYSLLEEATDQTTLAQTVACAGGKCDLL